MITDLLNTQACARGSELFLVTKEVSCTFAEVHAAALGFCRRLRSIGIVRGDHVALIAGNSASYLIAWFGISMAGATAVMLSNQLLDDGLQYALEQSDTSAIVADRAWIEGRGAVLTGELGTLPVVMIGDDQFIRCEKDEAFMATEECSDSDACAILYTSGSTGRPKGVLISHASYLAAGRHMVDAIALAPDDRILVCLPLYHANPQMYAVMSALHAGASIAILPRFSAGDFFRDAESLQCTGFTFVGTILSILAARHEHEQRVHGLRFAVGGGTASQVWRAVDERFGIRVHEVYGMTEIGGFVTINTIADYKQDTCGRARPDMDVRVFDEHDREVPTNSVGEIVVRPLEPHVILSGYYRQPEVTLAALRNLWFHTGDRGSYDEDGYLRFHGRSKELIRRGGEMISPVEIETALRAMPGVADCAVVGVADDIWGEELKAVIVGERIIPGEVREYLRGKVPAHMLPRYVELMSEIPKTETQKILRYRLQQLGSGVTDLQAPVEGSKG